MHVFKIFCSDHNTTVNYAKWQLLYSEFKNYQGYIASLNDGLKAIYKIEFPLAGTTSQVCTQVVEKFMPLALARPFVEEFITDDIIHQVIIT